MEELKSTAEVSNKLNPNDSSTFNLKWFVTTILAIWPWLLASTITTLIIGNLYLRYTTPIYRASAELLINDSKKGGSSNQDDLMQQLKINNNRINVDNEIEILKSRTMMIEVARKLHLNVFYSIAGRFKNTRLYNNKPFEFRTADSMESYYSCKVHILNENEYEIIEGSNKKIRGAFADTVNCGIGRVVLYKSKNFAPTKIEYTVGVIPLTEAGKQFMHAVELSSPSKATSCINLAMSDDIPERAVDVLNTLMSVYKQANINARSTIAERTMAFIDLRLDIVSSELSNVEKGIEEFKQQYAIADMSAQSTALVTTSSTTLEELSQLEVELEVTASISEYLKKAKDDESIVLPASLLDNAGLAGMMDKFNSIQTEIENNEISRTPGNPITKTLINQKNELKANIIAALKSSKDEMTIKVNRIKQQLGIINGKISEVPSVERLYLESSRKQSIKQDLYIFLLKKREETAIERSSTVADAYIIDPAISNGGPVLPNHSKILMNSLIAGLLIPFGVILIRRALNIRVISKSDIVKVTNIPILGEIGNNLTKENIAVERNSRTLISEQFRALRTNLQYMLTDPNNKVLMITSSMSGEGKSFVSANLAITLAMSGKKVVLLEFDLRKPKISRMLGIDNSTGFSNYSIGKASYEEIVLPSGIEDNLFILPSGPIPPNPAELILLPKTGQLFERLRADFDYILVDTSPVGLVTDAQLLYTYANLTLYIVRQGYTYKQQLQIANELYASGKMPRIGFIVNDVLASRGFSYGYGYEENYGYGYGYGASYGYGYGYGSYGGGYYVDNKKKSWRNWFSFKKNK